MIRGKDYAVTIQSSQARGGDPGTEMGLTTEAKENTESGEVGIPLRTLQFSVCSVVQYRIQGGDTAGPIQNAETRMQNPEVRPIQLLRTSHSASYVNSTSAEPEHGAGSGHQTRDRALHGSGHYPKPSYRPCYRPSIPVFIRVTVAATISAVVPQSVADITCVTNRDTASATTSHTNCPTAAETIADTMSESNRRTDSAAIRQSIPPTTPATTDETYPQTISVAVSVTVP
jgi:hypothetical protein